MSHNGHSKVLMYHPPALEMGCVVAQGYSRRFIMHWAPWEIFFNPTFSNSDIKKSSLPNKLKKKFKTNNSTP